MLDTGADISVFCKGAGLFQEFIKGMDGVTEIKKFSLGGFGVARENTMLWRFQCFNFSDKSGNSINYTGMLMAVSSKPNIPCDLILGITMFMKMRYMVDALSKKQFLYIESEKRNYGVGFYRNKEVPYIFAKD